MILLVSNLGFGQLKGVVINSKTKEHIPYVNIWVKNENKGTTSSEKGEFELKIEDSELILFSALGYETKQILSDSIQNKIELKPFINELEEVFINSNNMTQELVIGSFRKSKINHYFACGETPWMVSRYFEYKKMYEKTPFLQSIKVLSKSDLKDAKFNIRFYAVNDKGEPGDYLYSKNILGVARKGKKITEIDVLDLNIQFPRSGFFIAIEWLIIDANKFKYKITKKGFKEKFDAFTYEPAIGAVSSKTDQNSWVFMQGRWRKLGNNTLDENNHLAIELKLTSP